MEILTSKKLSESHMNIIIFGGTGDLATRKLLPALFRHHKASRLPDKINIIGIGSRALSNTEYQEFIELNLKEYLKKNNVIFNHFEYPDHYNYSRKDVNKILATTKNNIILTTKKDYYKLSQFKIDNLLYIDIKVKFFDGKQEFLSTIKEVLN